MKEPALLWSVLLEIMLWFTGFVEMADQLFPIPL